MSRGAGGRVRLGIIGLGTVAQAVHLPLLSRHRDRFEVTAVCELSAELAAVVTERFGLGAAERCRAAEELLDGGRVDAVLVLSSGSHGEVAGAALARGVAVFCEKPLAYTLAEADELARLSERTGAPLQLGYMKLYDPAVRRAARELAAANPSLRSVEVTVLHPSGPSQLAHAALAPPPGDIPPAVLSALGDETARLRAEAVGQGGVDSRRHHLPRPGYAPHRGTRPRAVAAQVPDELGQIYTEVLLGSVVHDLAVVRMLARGPGAGGVRGRVAGRDLGVGGGRGRLSGRGSVQPALALSGPVSRVPGGGAGAPRPGNGRARVPVPVPPQRAHRPHRDRPRRGRRAGPDPPFDRGGVRGGAARLPPAGHRRARRRPPGSPRGGPTS